MPLSPSSCCSDWLNARTNALLPPYTPVEQLRRDGDDRGDVDDRAGPARDEAWGYGVRQPGHRADVERDHVAHLIHVGHDQRAGGPDAGVVHQHCDAGICAENVLGPEGARPLSVRSATIVSTALPVVSLSLGGESAKPVAVSGDEDQVVAPPGKPVCIDRPYAPTMRR